MPKNKPELYLTLFFLLSASLVKADNLGSLLFHGNCTTCHYETQAVSAPSVLELKNRYVTAFPNKEDFVAYMSKWVQHPTLEGSIMIDAVNEYNLMPELAFEKSALESISAYIYDTDFSKKHKGHKD